MLANYGFRFIFSFGSYLPLLHKHIDALFCTKWGLVIQIFIDTKPTIARAWKTPTLNFEAVKNRLNDIMVKEKLTAKLINTHDTFLKVWHLPDIVCQPIKI